MPSDIIVCPHCDGAKGGPAFVHYADGSGGFQPFHPCNTCGGEGTITAEHAARMEEGRRRKEDRRARGLSLHDEAARLGITVRELSDIEQGRATT